MTITRLHQAGLEVDAQNSLALEFDAVTGTGITVVTTQPKTGQYHISLAAPGTGTTGHNVTKMLHPTNVYTQLRGGYHLKVTKDSWKSGSTTTSPVLFAFYQDSTEVAKVVIGTDGKWTAHVAGTQIAAARAGREDVYLHFGFQFKLDATTGIFKVFEDGLTMVDYAGDTIGVFDNLKSRRLREKKIMRNRVSTHKSVKVSRKKRACNRNGGGDADSGEICTNPNRLLCGRQEYSTDRARNGPRILDDSQSTGTGRTKTV